MKKTWATEVTESTEPFDSLRSLRVVSRRRKSLWLPAVFLRGGRLLEDRPREDEPASPQEGEPEPTQPFNPLFAIGGVVIAVISGVMMASGLLIPALVFLGVFAAFLGVQFLIFKVFPPPKG